MTIKNEIKDTNKVQRCEKVKAWLSENADMSPMYALLAILIIAALTFTYKITYGELSFANKGETLAKSIERANHPDILCMASESGAFRTYKAETYKIGKREGYGWNIWIEPHTDANAFHLSKCEIK